MWITCYGSVLYGCEMTSNKQDKGWCPRTHRQNPTKITEKLTGYQQKTQQDSISREYGLKAS
jgi:hypothetical protein